MFTTAALREEHALRMNTGEEAKFTFVNTELTAGGFTLFVLEATRITKTRKKVLEELSGL
jgi:hypothetical protein